jgi:hypothetical protein
MCESPKPGGAPPASSGPGGYYAPPASTGPSPGSGGRGQPAYGDYAPGPGGRGQPAYGDYAPGPGGRGQPAPSGSRYSLSDAVLPIALQSPYSLPVMPPPSAASLFAPSAQPYGGGGGLSVAPGLTRTSTYGAPVPISPEEMLRLQQQEQRQQQQQAPSGWAPSAPSSSLFEATVSEVRVARGSDGSVRACLHLRRCLSGLSQWTECARAFTCPIAHCPSPPPPPLPSCRTF